ncbi:hypothetical protein [Nocardioides koreensis]|uniref:hypothetical protein n=1 Tax=Nocardioides koreensis TaxID=433651 RepID=UPI0031D2696A
MVFQEQLKVNGFVPLVVQPLSGVQRTAPTCANSIRTVAASNAERSSAAIAVKDTVVPGVKPPGGSESVTVGGVQSAAATTETGAVDW